MTFTKTYLSLSFAFGEKSLRVALPMQNTLTCSRTPPKSPFLMCLRTFSFIHVGADNLASIFQSVPRHGGIILRRVPSHSAYIENQTTLLFVLRGDFWLSQTLKDRRGGLMRWGTDCSLLRETQDVLMVSAAILTTAKWSRNKKKNQHTQRLRQRWINE